MNKLPEQDNLKETAGSASPIVERCVISDHEKINELKQTVYFLEKKLNEKNVLLDSMYWVWCDGGCVSGVNRYATGELTEDIVLAAESNTTRLRQWFTNNNFRKAWKDMSEQQRAEWFENRKNL